MKSVLLALSLFGMAAPAQLEALALTAPAPAEAPAKARAKAIPRGPCATPLRATRVWLDYLQADRDHPDVAARCTETPEGMSDAGVQRAVRQLKRVFDARGLFLRYEEIPDTPDYEDPATGREEYVLSPLLTEVMLVKKDGRWVFPADVVRQADALYQSNVSLDLHAAVQMLPTWMRTPLLGISGLTAWQLGGLGLWILLGLIVRSLVSWLVGSQANRVLGRLRVHVAEPIVSAASTPLGNLTMAGVLAIGVPTLEFNVRVAQVSMVVVRTLAAVSVVMLIYRLVDVLAAWMQQRASKTETKLDDQLVPLVQRGLKLVTVAIGAVFVLQNLNVDVGSLLAGLGLSGLAVALASKDTISNLFGSVTIFVDKPFAIGDWVVASGVEGVVEEVGFRSTRIRTFYNSLVTVPNSKFTDAIVDNYGMRRYRRCRTTLGLTYDTTPERIEAFCDGVRALIKAHPATRKDYYEVHFSGYGDFSLNIMLYFFFDVPDWSDELRARHEIYLDILRLAKRIGVDFAFPTRTLHVDTVAKPEPLSRPEAQDRAALSAEVARFGPGGDMHIAPGPRGGEPYLAGAPTHGGDGAGEG